MYLDTWKALDISERQVEAARRSARPCPRDAAISGAVAILTAEGKAVTSSRRCGLGRRESFDDQTQVASIRGSSIEGVKLQRAGAACRKPDTRRWLVTRHRIGPVIRALQREPDPLFRRTGMSLD